MRLKLYEKLILLLSVPLSMIIMAVTALAVISVPNKDIRGAILTAGLILFIIILCSGVLFDD